MKSGHIPNAFGRWCFLNMAAGAVSEPGRVIEWSGKENKNKSEFSQEKEGKHKFPSERVNHCSEVF